MEHQMSNSAYYNINLNIKHPLSSDNLHTYRHHKQTDEIKLIDIIYISNIKTF